MRAAGGMGMLGGSRAAARGSAATGNGGGLLAGVPISAMRDRQFYYDEPGAPDRPDPAVQLARRARHPEPAGGRPGKPSLGRTARLPPSRAR